MRSREFFYTHENRNAGRILNNVLAWSNKVVLLSISQPKMCIRASSLVSKISIGLYCVGPKRFWSKPFLLRKISHGSMYYKIEQTKLSNGLEGFLQNVILSEVLRTMIRIYFWFLAQTCLKSTLVGWMGGWISGQ